jgi:hypothetical protein
MKLLFLLALSGIALALPASPSTSVNEPSFIGAKILKRSLTAEKILSKTTSWYKKRLQKNSVDGLDASTRLVLINPRD